MDKNELERRLEAAEKQNLGLIDEIKWLKEKLAEADDDKEIPEYPEFDYGDTLYAADVDCNGETKIRYMEITAKVRHRVYDVFHEELYAQEYAKKCKLIAMMLHCKWYIDRDVLDTSEKTWLYGICYDKEKKKFVYASYCSCDSCDPCTVTFIAEEAAKKAADWLNSHWKENDNDA